MPKGFKLEDVWMQVRQNTSAVSSAVASDIGLPDSAGRYMSTLLSRDLGVYNQSQAVNTAAQLLPVSQHHQDHKPAAETERAHRR